MSDLVSDHHQPGLMSDHRPGLRGCCNQPPIDAVHLRLNIVLPPTCIQAGILVHSCVCKLPRLSRSGTSWCLSRYFCLGNRAHRPTENN
eukprot:323366-Chlamydomonas_euryale.AAC.2